jgi:RNA polymerase sigma factor (sigma-70 family)
MQLEELLSKAKVGDLAAYDQIVGRFQDRVVAYGYALLKDRHLAEDAAQEAFLEAFRCLHGLRDNAAFAAWLRRIVFKQCNRITRRKEHPTLSLETATDRPDSIGTPQDVVERRESTRQVREAIASLPEHERVVLLLYYMGDHSQTKIAEFLEVPVSTVKTRLFTARRRLKEKMLPMIQENLEETRPSKDVEFVTAVKDMMRRYRQQYKSNAATANKGLLQEVKKQLTARLESGPLEPELMHHAIRVNMMTGDDSTSLELLSRYLAQPLLTDEEIWARSSEISGLVSLGHSADAVQKHRELIAWAREHLPRERWLGALQRGAGSLFWIKAGQGEEWFRLYSELAAQVTPTAANLTDFRHYYVALAFYYRLSGRPPETLPVAARLHELAQAFPQEPTIYLSVEGFLIEINAYTELGDTEAARRSGTAATTLLNQECVRQRAFEIDSDQPQERVAILNELATLHHNLGASLYFAHQYDLAIPVLRRSIALKGRTNVVSDADMCIYTWLAASLWATGADRPEVLALLRQAAAHHWDESEWWTNSLPEFEDVRKDEEFLAAVTGKPDR